MWKPFKKKVVEAPKAVIPLPLDEHRIGQRDAIHHSIKGVLQKFKHNVGALQKDEAIVNHQMGIDVRQITFGKKTETHTIIATFSIHALDNSKLTLAKEGNKKHANNTQLRKEEQHSDSGSSGSVRKKRA